MARSPIQKPVTQVSPPISAEPNSWVCERCLADPYLHTIGASSPIQRRCISCGDVRGGLTIDDVAERVEQMLSAYYHQAPNEPEGYEYYLAREAGYWEPPGAPLSTLLEEELQTSDAVALAICDRLSEREGGHRFIAEGGEPAYGADQHYVLSGLFPDLRQHEAFWAFEQRLRYEARHFHPESRAILNSIFQSVDQLTTDDGRPVVVVAEPGTALARLHRGRVFQSDEALERALIAPDQELGSPPKEVTRAGRMNPSEVSMFYGATTTQTALAEVRAPAHARVLIGQFELLRPVRLLDVGALKSVLVDGSKFDPAHQVLGRHALLLQTVSWRISQPVLPDHQQGAYLVTQAIADFLAYECTPAFDGMIYPSTQTVDAGQNVVLFHPAARCEATPPAPGSHLSASLTMDTEDGPEPDYTVWVRANDPRAAPPASHAHSSAPDDHRVSTLRLMRETLMVHHVVPVEVHTEAHPVTEHHSDAAQVPSF
jgi:hypothetical protein